MPKVLLRISVIILIPYLPSDSVLAAEFTHDDSSFVSGSIGTEGAALTKTILDEQALQEPLVLGFNGIFEKASHTIAVWIRKMLGASIIHRRELQRRYEHAGAIGKFL